MNVFIEFSRKSLKENPNILHLIKKSVLGLGHKINFDLLKRSKIKYDEVPLNVHKSLEKAVSESDAIIIEGSMVGLAMGYVLTEALAKGKPVLYLTSRHREHYLSGSFIYSIKDKLLNIKTYNSSEELPGLIEDFLNNCKFIKTRFNLVLNLDLDNYVTNASKEAKTSKTKFIINLINKDARNKQ